MYVCTYHWAPGRVAFRLKAAPVKIRIFLLYTFFGNLMNIQTPDTQAINHFKDP